MKPLLLTGVSNWRRSLMLVCLCWWMSTGTTLWAHNPNTSYTKVRISSEALDCEFTFDIVTLLRVTNLDENRDAQITPAELRQQAPVLLNFIRRHVTLELGEAEVASDFGEAEPPVWPADMKVITPRDYQTTLIHFRFHKSLSEMPGEFTLIYDLFAPLGDLHSNIAVIEQGKFKSEEIVFTKFEPDYTYDTSVNASFWEQAQQFGRLGVKHIFLGPDHILFLLGLIVVSRLKELVKVVTSFTVAHTITLILAALGFVKLPARLVDIGVAVTIVYVGVENLLVKDTRRRWMLTFGFGLIHGFGFANVLRDAGLPTVGLARSLLSFNVGVEIGQLIIVLLALPIALWLGRQSFGTRAQQGMSVLVAILGAAWLVDRAFAIGFMPI